MARHNRTTGIVLLAVVLVGAHVAFTQADEGFEADLAAAGLTGRSLLATTTPPACKGIAHKVFWFDHVSKSSCTGTCRNYGMQSVSSKGTELCGFSGPAGSRTGGTYGWHKGQAWPSCYLDSDESNFEYHEEPNSYKCGCYPGCCRGPVWRNHIAIGKKTRQESTCADVCKHYKQYPVKAPADDYHFVCRPASKQQYLGWEHYQSIAGHPERNGEYCHFTHKNASGTKIVGNHTNNYHCLCVY